MPDRSGLVRTPITDRNGKQTTVYRSAARPAAAAAIPGPSVMAPSAPGMSYADRRAEIAEANARWRADSRRPDGDLLRAEIEADYGVHRALNWTPAPHPKLLGNTGMIWSAKRANESVRLVLAFRYAPLWTAANSSRMGYGEFASAEPVRFGPEHVPAFESLMRTVRTLQDFDMIEHGRLPRSDDDERVLAVLWFCSASGANAFEHGFLTTTIVEYMHLVHEAPDRATDIARMYRDRMPPGAARRALSGPQGETASGEAR